MTSVSANPDVFDGFAWYGGSAGSDPPVLLGWTDLLGRLAQFGIVVLSGKVDLFISSLRYGRSLGRQVAWEGAPILGLWNDGFFRNGGSLERMFSERQITP